MPNSDQDDTIGRTPMKMSIGSFLIDRLVSLGVSRIYGVPGDYNLEFLELLENSKRLAFVGTCNELNAAYAADGEARLKGISVVLTTYGVGDLATLPGVAGAYAEGVPVLSISGAPPLRAIRSKALLHHTLADGNYRNVMNCFREFTVAQALITPEKPSMRSIVCCGPAGGRSAQSICSSLPTSALPR